MLGFPLFISPYFFAEPMVLGALLISVSVGALSYMVGEALSNNSIKAFGKLELKELGVSAIIIVIAILLATPGLVFDIVGRGFVPTAGGVKVCEEWESAHGTRTTDPVTGTEYYTNGNIAIGAASYFLGCKIGFTDLVTAGTTYVWGSDRGVLMPEILGNYFEFMMVEVVTGFLSTFNIGISLKAFVLPPFEISVDLSNIMPFGFVTPINEAHTLLVDVTGTMMAATAAQKMLLVFIETNVPKVILPLGLIMRAFPFTRKTGSTIVAFAFAAYFIYPLTILLNWQMYERIQHPPCAQGLEADGKTCSADAQCCSGTCLEGECATRFTEFQNYDSALTICRETSTNSLAERVETMMQQEAAREAQGQEDLNSGRIESASPGSKTQDRIRAALEERQRQENLKQSWLSGAWYAVMPSTSSVLGWAWSVLERVVMGTARMTILILLFIVIEIVVTLTLFKDFSLLIGGEPRLLGISKLV